MTDSITNHGRIGDVDRADKPLKKQDHQRQEIIEILLRIEERLGNLATKAEFDSAIAAVRTEIADAVADRAANLAKIAELEAQVAAGGMTAEEETAALADIAALRDEVDEITPDEPEPAPE